MNNPVAAIAAPPRATVHAAIPVKSNELCRIAAEVGDDPDAAVRVPLCETEEEEEEEAEDEDEAEDRELVIIEDAAEEEEEEEEALYDENVN